MNAKAAGLISLMEVLTADVPTRNDMMGRYQPPTAPTGHRHEDPKAKARRKQATRSRKINRKGK